VATAALLQADPRAVTVAAQLRAQQSITAPRGLAIPAPYLDEFARAVVRWSGLDDLKKLRPTRQTVYIPETESSGPDSFDAWVYDVRAPNAEPVGEGMLFALSLDDKLSFWVRWVDPPGAPIFYVQPNVRESWFTPLVPLIAFAGSFIGLPALIGEAVLGPAAAAAYPAASQALGSVALQTALTGGNIEAAARSAAASFTGAQFGDVVGSGLDSAAIGTVTAAATTAAIQGGDVQKAVLRSLVNVGVRAVDETTFGPDVYDPSAWDWGSADLTPGMDQVTWDDLGVTLDPSTVDDALTVNQDVLDYYGVPMDSLLPDAQGNLTDVTGEWVEMTEATYAQSLYVDDQGNVRGPDNSIIIPAKNAENMTEGDIAQAVQTSMAQQQGVIKDSQPAPASRPAALPPAASQVKTPTITDMGKLAEQLAKSAAVIAQAVRQIKTGVYTPPYATSPNGTPRNTPPGVPIQRPDGSVVTNNGNGTQTVRYPDGRVVTMPSSVSAGATTPGALIPGVSNQTLLIGGAVLVGALLLARRR